MRIPGKPSAEDGFTFIETLACAFIMALVIGAIAPLVDASIRTLDRIAREERRAHRIALAYDAFHSACSRTCPPPWARMGTLVEKKGDELLIYYADGELDASWSLRIEEKSIEVDDGDVTVAFEADSARVTPITLGTWIIGLELSFDAMGRTWTWREYFGARGA